MKELMNPIKKLFYKHIAKKQKNHLEEEWEFIWGVKSYDDLSPGSEANRHTMNDIDVLYDKKSETYHLGIETIYGFDDWENGPRQYVKRLLDEMTKWMNEQGRDTNYSPCLWEVFTDLLNTNHGFDSIESAYGSFKFLADAFCAGLEGEATDESN